MAYVRTTWRALTSMGTALVLLFLLALAAIPGALWPQRNVNPSTVARYLADNPRVGPWLDRLQVPVDPWLHLQEARKRQPIPTVVASS